MGEKSREVNFGKDPLRKKVGETTEGFEVLPVEEEQKVPEQKPEAKIEGELSPEIIEKIMDKVQDINTQGTAFTVIDSEYPMKKLPTGEEKLESIFTNGIIGTHIKQPDIEREKFFNPTTKEKYIDSIKSKDKPDVFFNIIGRGSAAALHNFPEDEYIDNYACEIAGYNSEATLIIFDISKYKEEEVDGKKPLPSRTYSIYHGQHSLGKITRNKKGKPVNPLNERGFRLSPRVPPRYFKGICFKMIDKNSIDKKYKSAEENPLLLLERAKQIANQMVEVNSNKSEYLIPIYDIYGNLWWPKQMSYEEVKKFVEERDREKSKEK